MLVFSAGLGGTPLALVEGEVVQTASLAFVVVDLRFQQLVTDRDALLLEELKQVVLRVNEDLVFGCPLQRLFAGETFCRDSG
mgnify:CR=1 FL=1